MLGGNQLENVLMNKGDQGLVITGVTNQTNLGVVFDSDEILLAGANRQADIEPGTGNSGLDFFSFYIPGGFFTGAEFNLDSTADGSVLFNVDWFNIVNGTTGSNALSLDQNGSKWFTIQAVKGQVITKVSLQTDVDLSVAKQIRLGGAGTFQEDPVVPEPGTYAMLGSGLLGLAVWQRRRARV